MLAWEYNLAKHDSFLLLMQTIASPWAQGKNNINSPQEQNTATRPLDMTTTNVNFLGLFGVETIVGLDENLPVSLQHE